MSTSNSINGQKFELRHNNWSWGQSTVEYASIITLTSLLVILVLGLLGANLRAVYCGIVGVFGDAPDNCEIGLLWGEQFDDLDDWNFTAGGDWENADGQACVSGNGEHRGFTGEEGWEDYTVRVERTELTQGNGYGLYFRTSNEPAINGYVFQYDPGYRGGRYRNGAFLIRRVVNGRETPPIAAEPAPLDFEWHGTSRDVSVNVQGDTFTATIDGEQVLQGQDSQFPNGRVGLRSWDRSRVCFDNLTVSR